MADPTDFNKLDDLKFITGLTIQPVLAAQQEIIEKINLLYGEDDDLEHALSDIDLDDPTAYSATSTHAYRIAHKNYERSG